MRNTTKSISSYFDEIRQRKENTKLSEKYIRRQREKL